MATSDPTPQAQAPQEPGTDNQVIRSWQQVDSLIESMQSAVRDYSKQLNEYVGEQERQQQEAAETLRQQIIDELAAQREEAEALRRQLDEDRAAADADRRKIDEELNDLDRMQRELDDREKRLDAQSNEQEAERQRLDAARAELEAARSELEALRSRTEAAAQELEQREAALNERSESLEAEVAKRAEEIEATLARRTEEIEAELQRRSEELDQTLARRSEEIDAELARRTQELESLKSQNEAQSKDLQQRSARMEKREADMKLTAERAVAELREQKQQVDADARKRTEELDARTKSLDERQASVEQGEKELDDRRAKLRQYKDILDSQTQTLRAEQEALEPTRQSAERVLRMHDDVIAQSREMAKVEARMIRRWGVQKSFAWVTAAVVCLAVMAGVSYLIAGKLADRVWAATAVVQMDGAASGDTAAWAADQMQIMLSEKLIDSAMITMRQIGYTGPATPEHIRSTLDGGLHVNAPSPGVLHVELHGGREEELAPILGGIVRAYAASEQWAKPGTIVQGATLANTPIQDNRMETAGKVFGVTGAIGMLLFFATMFFLTRQKPVETLAVGVDEDAEVWSRHARNLRHNPDTEAEDEDGDDADDAPARRGKAAVRSKPEADEPAAKGKAGAKAKDKADKRSKKKDKVRDRRESGDEAADDDAGKTVIDMAVKYDESAETMVDGHAAPVEDEQQPPARGKAGKKNARGADNAATGKDGGDDNSDPPEFKPLA